jgi:hypothetical protein
LKSVTAFPGDFSGGEVNYGHFLTTDVLRFMLRATVTKKAVRANF